MALMRFQSQFNHVGRTPLPLYSGTRVMMMPFHWRDVKSIPEDLQHYRYVVRNMQKIMHTQFGVKDDVAYLTIDEKLVLATQPHRRAGLHVDGVYKGLGGGWGGGGGWGVNGMLTVSSHVGCRAWNQEFEGAPGDEGECEHLSEQLGTATVFEPFAIYWLGGLCVHESIPQRKAVKRQFVRLSFPSASPWFEGYTENPLGIKPAGPILSRREFMNA